MSAWGFRCGLAGAVALFSTYAEAGPVKKVPYWASITKNEARMRVGPSYDYPSNWLYRRRGLPVKVVQVLGNWRKVEDSSGTQGWMHVRLLSDTPTAIVTSLAPMYESRGGNARIAFRAEPGVVGALSDCASGWCLFDVAGQRGYVRAEQLWGSAGR
jgi:SH3-like domain-containing protein